MKARITSSIRIKDGEDTRRYYPGDVAEGESAKRAISEGAGVEIKEAKAPKNKAAKTPKNKSA